MEELLIILHESSMLKTKVFTTTPSCAIKKMQEIIEDGWDIISHANTSTAVTPPDAHGNSYGGESYEILARKKICDNNEFMIKSPII